MPDVFDQIHAEASPATGGDVFDQIHAANNPEASGYGHELYRQLIADPIKAIKSNPLGALTTALGTAFSVINPGFDPVPEGRHITLTQPTQGEAVQDIVNRGPGAVGAAATLGGLGLAAPFIGRNIGTIGTATSGALKGAGKAAIASAPVRGLGFAVPGGNVMAGAGLGGAAAHYLGLPEEAGAIVGGAAPLVRGAISGAREALANRAAGGAAATSSAALLDDIAMGQAGKTFARLDPAAQQTVRDIAQRINSQAAVPTTTPPPAKVVPISPVPTPSPAEAQPLTQAATTKPVPVATRMATAARAARAGNADTLAQGLQDTGISADMADTIPRFKWRDIAKAHGVDWPASSDAQFKLIGETRAALRQRMTKP